ncbi:ABC-type polysaccharide/polyol phosphate transport system ATPase subunit [Bacilli bacterium PM5-9]|nr:ABC-type polysaccharide/polyol phosphate transport system ATPase subunit [Bacilli bacterium PM5-9]
MEPIIELKNINKRYYLNYSKRHRFMAMLNGGKSANYKLALDNIDLKIYPGDVVGVIGKNGSGKSTLLKILTGVTFPTSGEMRIDGSVAMLAVKSFLVNEMTGRENIYLKLKLLGMKKEEIENIEQEIIDFSEVGEYIDIPVKQYSSGMKSKLGFSISININPDILIIDEALAVGDSAFKRKCLEKIREFKERNKTIIYVSHSSDSILSFCNRAILLDEGVKIKDGTTDEIANYYNSVVDKIEKDKALTLLKYTFDNESREYLKNEPINTYLKYSASDFEEELFLNVIIRDLEAMVVDIFTLDDFTFNKNIEDSINFDINRCELKPGQYTVSIQAIDSSGGFRLPIVKNRKFKIKE